MTVTDAEHDRPPRFWHRLFHAAADGGRGVMASGERGMAGGDKIRVGFFLPHLRSGGIERIVVNLLRHLDRTRFDPCLLLASRMGDLLNEVPRDVPVRDLRGRAMRFLPPRLAGLLNATACDVVYSGTNAANLVLVTATRMLRRKPALIVSEHTPASQYLQKAKWRAARLAAMRTLYPLVHSVAVPLPEIGDELNSVLRRPALATRVLYNPVVTASMLDAGKRKAHRADPATKPYSFVAAGRLHPVKGFDVLIESFSRVADVIPESRLTILGEGPDREELEDKVRTAGLSGRVELPGFVADPTTIIRDADAFVLSSRREGCPNVIVEALASGTPVIATDCGPGLASLLENGSAGLLVPPENPERLSRAMERLAAHPELRIGMIRRGFVQASRFEIGPATARFEEEFARAAAARSHTVCGRAAGSTSRPTDDVAVS